MKTLILLGLAIFINYSSFAQQDTTVIYYIGYEETAKENADSYIKLHKNGNLWHGKKYDLTTGLIQHEGDYLDKTAKKRTGTFNYYSDKGRLKSIALYNDTSKKIEHTYFYEDGSKQSQIRYTNAGKAEQQCWEKNGKEKSDCQIEKEARFRGGLQGWKTFLEQNLNAMVAADAGAPAGQYPVTVQFTVNKKGEVSNLKPLSVPKECIPCATEVMRVLSSGPRWEPATINGEPVTYQAIQKLTFQVEESPQRKRRF